jgi:peroxiredoxin
MKALVTDLNRECSTKKWPRGILLVVGLTHLLFPLYMVFGTAYKPDFLVDFLIYFSVYPFFVGVALLMARINPVRFWPLIFVVLAKKLVAPLVLLLTASFSWKIVLVSLLFDVIWVPPLMIVLAYCYCCYLSSDNLEILTFEESLTVFQTSNNHHLKNLVQGKDVLVVFLRHFGCPFCKEILSDLVANKEFLVEKKIQVVLVFMVTHSDAKTYLKHEFLQKMECVSDPERLLYKAFGLRRGRLYQIFGLKVCWRGFLLRLFKGVKVGPEVGDALQMPGVFLLNDGNVKNSFQPEYISDVLHIKKFIDGEKF